MSMDPMKSLLVNFDLKTGLSPDRSSIQRRLSAMQGMFSDEDAYTKTLAREDALVYEFYDLGLPERDARRQHTDHSCVSLVFRAIASEAPRNPEIDHPVGHGEVRRHDADDPACL